MGVSRTVDDSGQGVVTPRPPDARRLAFPSRPISHSGLAAHVRATQEGHNYKESGHDSFQAASTTHPWRDPRLSGAAVARYRRISTHDRAAVRGPREVHQSARGSDAFGYVHSARDTEERLRR